MHNETNKKLFNAFEHPPVPSQIATAENGREMALWPVSAQPHAENVTINAICWHARQLRSHFRDWRQIKRSRASTGNERAAPGLSSLML